MLYPGVEIAMAYVLDLIAGDPRWFPHPVKGIGRLIEILEVPLRKSIENERKAGVVLAVLVTCMVYAASFALIKVTRSFNAYLGSAVSILLVYTTLATKDLGIESMKVHKALEEGDMHLARKNLGLIVGRDTDKLDKQDVVRATVETVSENTVDGIISPLFYAFIGGAPLALAYKAVNTLDSMVGYKNERYRNFGWASAKTDDWANFIPARLSAVLLPVAGFLTGKDGLRALRIAWRDRKKSPSPNSGIPEAAVAGALGIQLGGLNFYDSVACPKPVIGDRINSLGTVHIEESIRISYVCSVLMLFLGWFLMLVMERR